MASNIDPTIVDGEYPIAGKDQPSQGFRTNFTGINENFTAAAAEITELQSKAVLKAALSGTTLDNNMQGAEIVSAKMRDLLLPVSAINWSASQINSLDVLSGGYQSVTINQSGTYTVNFNNFSRFNGYSTVLLQVNNQGNNRVALPGGKTYLGLEKITNASNNSLYFYNSDPTSTTRTVLSFSSADGNTFIVQDLTRDVAGLNYGIPTSFPEGRPGDKQGDVRVYQSNVYVCTQDYTTGGDAIWTVASGGGSGGGGPAGNDGQVQYAVNSTTGPVFAANENFVFSSTTGQLFVPQILANRGIEISNLAPLTVSGDITGRNITAYSGGVYGNLVGGNLSILNISTFGNLVVNNLTSNVLIRGNTASFTGDITSNNLTVNSNASLNNVTVSGTLGLNSLTVGSVQYANSGATTPGQVLGVTSTNTLGFFSVPGATPQSSNLTVQFADYSTGIGRFAGNTNFTYDYAAGINRLTTPNLSVGTLATISNAGITNGTITNLTATNGDITTLRATSANINSQYSLPTTRASSNGYVLAGYTDGTTAWISTPASYGNSNVVALLANFGSNSISTTGNVTAGYLLGNGALLTGIAAGYSNSNVAAYLPTYTGQIGAVNSASYANINGYLLVSTTTKIWANGAIQNSSNITTPEIFTDVANLREIAGANGSITISSPVQAASDVDVLGNVTTSGYFIGDGGLLSNVPGATVAGSNTQVQFNNGGVLGATSAFTFNKANSALFVQGNITTSLAVNASTVNASTITATAVTTGSLDTSAANVSDLAVSASAIFGDVLDPVDIFVSGNANIVGETYLSDVSNVHILSGNSGQVLTTDGSGNLSWTTVARIDTVTTVTTTQAVSAPGIYAINSPTANITLTLPKGNASIIGYAYSFKDIGGNAFNHPVTIAAQGSDLIDGAATTSVGSPYSNMVLMYLTSNVWGVM